ncbi:Suppressor of the cold-sensitive snRNP biogenesis mutant brr1-1 [Elasticomyces elasticus]|nr:Suppressor of the cold-sensitive snRNP biogenesis mutant brr1-1 [Elasticomyces elasticus]
MHATRDAIETYLKHPSEKEFWNYTSKVDGVLLWYAYLTDAQACDVAAFSGVDSVEVDGPLDIDGLTDPPSDSSKKRAATTLATQISPVLELRVISQPTDVANVGSLGNYVYDGTAGEGIYIYVVESGINTASADLQGRVVATMHAPQAKKDNPGDGDESENGHATCSASKAVGLRYGVAKGAKVIAVKTKFSTADTAVVFDMVREDIQARGLQKKAVVNMSWGALPSANGNIPDNYQKLAVSQQHIMNDLDVPIVAAAGNLAESGRQNIEKLPARWAKDDYPIISVGSTTMTGVASAFSQGGPALAVSAVGEGLTCAAGSGTGNRVARGTSYAAPQVAGLLAYFLGQETVPFDTTTGSLANNARNFLKNTASWSRSGDGNMPKVAWNLITKAQNPPSS